MLQRSGFSADLETLTLLVAGLVRRHGWRPGVSDGRLDGGVTDLFAMHWWARQQLKSKNPQTRREAIEKLTAEVPEEAVGEVLSLLQDPDATVRRAVFAALGSLKATGLLTTVIDGMRDTAAEVREEAIRTVMAVGDGTCVNVLVGALKDSAPEVRQQAARALRHFNWHPSNTTQAALLRVALGQYGEASDLGAVAIDPLLAVLRDPRAAGRPAALEALGRIGDERTLKPLLGAVKDGDPHVRVAAIEAIASQRDTRGRDVLQGALKDPDAAVRAAAASALGQVSDESTLERLVASLKDSNWSVRKAAVETLGRARDLQSVGPLTLLLEDPDHDVREAVVEALGQIRSKLAVEALIPALTDPQSSIRRAAETVLRRIDSDWIKSDAARRAIPALKSRLGSRDYWVRQTAADVLSRIGDMRRSEPTLSAFTDPIHYKRLAALQAMMQMAADWDDDVRLAGVESLGRLADERAEELLKGAQKDRNEWVRLAAEESLRRLRRDTTRFRAGSAGTAEEAA